MRNPTEQDFHALFARAALEPSVLEGNRTLKMPLHIVITDGNDDLVSEFELSRDAAGKVSDKMLSPAKLVQLREFAAKQEWTIAREYIDRETGATSDREQFQAMFTDAGRSCSGAWTGSPVRAS